MSEVKLSVSITLPGSVMFSEKEAKSLEKEKPGTGYELSRKKVINQRNESEVVTIKIRKSKPAKQTISMTEEAYKYMTGSDSCLPKIASKVWSRMSKKQRLEAHLDSLCKYFEGTSYTYKVFDD